jgi:hypothetical protein
MKPVGWKIALYIALVFAAGIGVGVLAQRYVIPVPVQGHGHPPRESDRFRREMVDELTKRLKLDSGQVTQLEGVLDDSRKAFQDFRERHKDEMKAIYDRQHEQIAAILRPDQRVAYDKLRAEREAEMKKHEREEEAKKPHGSGH